MLLYRHVDSGTSIYICQDYQENHQAVMTRRAGTFSDIVFMASSYQLVFFYCCHPEVFRGLRFRDLGYIFSMNPDPVQAEVRRGDSQSHLQHCAWGMTDILTFILYHPAELLRRWQRKLKIVLSVSLPLPLPYSLLLMLLQSQSLGLLPKLSSFCAKSPTACSLHPQ